MNLPSLALRFPLTMALMAVSGAGLAAARLMPESVAAWRTYTAATEQRIGAELAVRDGFLAMDFRTDAAASRAAVMAGQVVIREVETRDARGEAIDMPSALLQHWRAAVFVPGTTAHDVMARLAVEAPPAGQDDVVKSAVIARGPDRIKVYLQLRAKKVVTAYYNTEHEVTFAHHGAGRGSTRSVATKVAELREFGTPAEYELPPGNDRGFLWRLNAYWRYQDVPGGVIAEVESLTLSRSVPSIFSYLVGPMIERTARESIERAVLSMRARFGR